jgi:hypothetical protein
LWTTATGTLVPVDGRAAAEWMVDFLNLSYDFCVVRLLANKYELLTVLNCPNVLLHTNGSKRDLRTQVIERKISSSTRSN